MFLLFDKTNNYTIELIERYPCNDINELFKRKGYYIRYYQGITLNKYIAGRTVKEYEIEEKDKIKERSRLKYNNTNKVLCSVCSIYLRKDCFIKHTKSNRHRINLEFNQEEK